MSTISASTTSTTAYKVTADTTGTLVLQTGSGPTTAVTVGTDQSVTFAQAANLPNTFGFKNRIINGAMMIDQRNAGASVTPTSSAYTLDRWRLGCSQSSKLTVQQVSTAPSGFTNSTKITVASAFSPGVSDEFWFQQRIEGYNVADLGFGSASASSVTISFWVNSSVTGTYSVSLQNSATNYSYVGTITVNVANTWEYKTLVVTGVTAGTWVTDNGVGLYLNFDLGSGSSMNTTAGSWQSGYFRRTSGSVSFVNNAAATFYITGVQLEKGSTATSFDYRPYGTELALCQRYAQVIRSNASGTTGLANLACISSTRAYGEVPFELQMRSAPTISFSAANTFTTRNNSGTGLTLTAISAANTNIYSFDLDVSVSSGLSAGDCTSTSMLAGTSGLITISAEL